MNLRKTEARENERIDSLKIHAFNEIVKSKNKNIINIPMSYWNESQLILDVLKIIENVEQEIDKSI